MTAQAAMVAARKTLFWFPGSYTISQSLDLSNANTRHVSFGGVTINFTGTGPAIIFDGGATVGALYDVTFGSREFPFKVVGNPNCTTLAFCRATHQCNINIIGRTDAALEVLFAVNSKFYIKCSTNDGGAMSPLPASTRCHFEHVHYTNSWTMNSLTSTWRNVYDGAGVYLQDVLKRPQNFASLAAPSASISGAITTVTPTVRPIRGAQRSAREAVRIRCLRSATAQRGPWRVNSTNFTAAEKRTRDSRSQKSPMMEECGTIFLP
jgi:hypothetical protein